METLVRDQRSGNRDVRIIEDGRRVRARWLTDRRDVVIDVLDDVTIPGEMSQNRAPHRTPARFAPATVEFAFERKGECEAHLSPWSMTMLQVSGPLLRKDGSHGQRRITNSYLTDSYWDCGRYRKFPVPEWLGQLVDSHNPETQGWPLDDEEV